MVKLYLLIFFAILFLRTNEKIKGFQTNKGGFPGSESRSRPTIYHLGARLPEEWKRSDMRKNIRVHLKKWEMKDRDQCGSN